MNNELFTDLNPTESQDINGGWLFSGSANYSSSSSYSYTYEKSNNRITLIGDFKGENARGAQLGNGNTVGQFNQYF
jgi:hypothetical protein